MITLLNMIFANPIAYLIFPNMVNTYNTSTTTEYAVYGGYLNLYKDNKLVKLFTGTSTIDLSDVSGRIRFDNVTDTYSAVVGEWDLAKSLDQIMEDNIRQAMVLWYDIAKQGATNESMAANPTLRDLSGNGHDATCYNFAWSGMSGIGGYPFDSTYWGFRDNITLRKETEYKWIVSSTTAGPLPIIHTYNSGINIRPAYTIKISGMPEGVSAYLYEDVSKILINGINHIEEQQIDATEIAKHVGIGFNNVFSNQSVIIEFVPIYPHALVSDGVDDYCLVEGLPLLNKEDGYTVIAKRKWLTEDLTVESLIDKCFLSDISDGSKPLEGAYAVELNLASGCYAQSCGNRTSVNISEDDIIYQTSQSYCGQSINISPDFVEGNGLFELFNFGLGYYAPIALNSILLFNRDLTPEEIEWVKTNLIETEQ